ncbi:Rho GTPase activating protein 10 [Mortierella alpina]|nr:Rho GTPase activating protein 10 [Mortierella alpina]
MPAVTGEHNNTQNSDSNSALRSATTDDDSQSSGSCAGSMLSEFSHNTTPSAHSASSTRHQSLSNPKHQDVPDLQLLKSLASFLKGEADDEDTASSVQGNLFSRAASPSNDADTHEVCDLVVHVRDFAYPKSHSYHFGNYPPEPEYEESDIEEEEEEEESHYYTHNDAASTPFSPEQDKTQGHARGLYDFDAETASELSFKEGDCLWIHCRRFPGWFLGEIAGVQGLVPENYVQML